MKKNLPITEKTNLRTYTFYSYLDAIIANDFRAGEIAARIIISNYKKYNWIYTAENLVRESEGNEIVFRTNRFNIAMNAWLFRTLEINDEFELKINYQQYSQPWGNISIAITDEECMQMGTPMILQYGNFNKAGRFYRDSKGNIYTEGTGRGIDESFVVRRQGDSFSLLSRNEKEDTLVHLITIDGVAKKKCRIGVVVNLYCNQYYAWLYNNHIQWRLNKEDREIRLEFDSTIRRNWNYYTLNNFVLYKTEDLKTLKKYHIVLIDYIKGEIDKGKYVELVVDTYDLEETYGYSTKHKEHQCLIYGYDDSERILEVLCTDEGRPCKSRITYERFMKQSNFYPDDLLIVSQEYNPEKNVYDITIKSVVEQLHKYLKGEPVINSEIIVAQEEAIYGIDVYDWLRKGRYMTEFLNDVRLVHLMFEHKKCILELAEYLVSRKFLDVGASGEIINELNVIFEKVSILRNFVFLHMAKQSEGLVEKIDSYLSNIQDLERKTYSKFILLLENELRK